MVPPKSQPETTGLAEDISNLSADKRALLLKRLTNRSRQTDSPPAEAEYTGQRHSGARNDLLEHYMTLMRQQSELTSEPEIVAWIEQVKAEAAALQQKFESGQIDSVEWSSIRIYARGMLQLLIEQHPHNPTVQQLSVELLNQQLAHKLLGHLRYKFTYDFFSHHIKQWERNLGALKGRPNLRFLEIGSFEGWSTCWMLENILTDPTSTIICIDRFDQTGQEEYFDYNTEKSGAAYKVTKLRGLSQLALRFLTPNWFDFIYIDGSHVPGDILQDAILAWELLKRKGFLVFDDYEYSAPLRLINPTLMQPKQAIDAFLTLIEGRHTIIHKGWQVTLRKVQ